jgi:hypothetical protein
MARKILTQERLKELLNYDPATGVFTWRIPVRANVKAGQRAGSIHPKGYVIISVDKRLTKAHRLAWLYVHGEMPPAELDHINRIPNDNRIANLRLADRYINTQNTGLQKNNTSGYRGVTWHKSQQKWRARISIQGKMNELGYFHSKEDAAKRYEEVARVHHSVRYQ